MLPKEHHASRWKFRCYEAKSEEAGSHQELNPRHLLSCQCSATEPWQPDNHQPPTILHTGLAPGNCQPFHFPLFHLITSEFLYFQLEAKCSEDLERVNHSAWVLSWQRKLSRRRLTELWQHIPNGCQVRDWGIQYHLCSTYLFSPLNIYIPLFWVWTTLYMLCLLIT